MKYLLAFILSLMLMGHGIARAATSCTPSAAITEYYLDSSGNPQSRSVSTVTTPIVTDGLFADYNGSDPPCALDQVNNGQYVCQNWEVPSLTIKSANPLGSVSDANVNSTLQMFSIWGSAPYTYTDFGIPSINPQPWTYKDAVSPEWNVLSTSMDGTCYVTVVADAGQKIGDIIESGGVYAPHPSLCEPNVEACQDDSRTSIEHWVIVAMDNMGVQSSPQVGPEVSKENRGSCATMHAAFNTVSNAHNTTCPGTE